MSEKKTIALFGGTFDPPHFGHALVITSLLHIESIDEVWIVPTGSRLDKAHVASAKQRKEMLEIFIESIFSSPPNIRIEECEIEEEIPGSTTIDLLRFLEAQHPSHSFLFAIGADLLDGLDTWKEAEELKRRKQFVMIPRFTSENPRKVPDHVRSLSKEIAFANDISSTTVRKLVSEGKCVRGLVPKEVETYFKKEKIY